MKIRVLAVLSTALLATTLALAVVAPAAEAAPPSNTVTTPVPCTIAGVADTCTLQVQSFSVVNGVLTATGTVTGQNVSVPFQAAPVQTGTTCPVLNLTLGPLHLNLLGLVVDLNQVNLNITAQRGPGNLLGNLLCAVTNLLNGSGSGAGVQNLLNTINGLLGGA